MVQEIIEIFTDAFTALVSSLIDLLNTAFAGLVYNETDGLSGIATWALVFLGVGMVTAAVARFTKA
jgi:hypothetical protein